MIWIIIHSPISFFVFQQYFHFDFFQIHNSQTLMSAPFEAVPHFSLWAVYLPMMIDLYSTEIFEYFIHSEIIWTLLNWIKFLVCYWKCIGCRLNLSKSGNHFELSSHFYFDQSALYSWICTFCNHYWTLIGQIWIHQKSFENYSGFWEQGLCWHDLRKICALYLHQQTGRIIWFSLRFWFCF